MSDKNVSVYRQNEYCQVLEYILSPDRISKDADSKTRIFDGFRLDVSSHWKCKKGIFLVYLRKTS